MFPQIRTEVLDEVIADHPAVGADKEKYGYEPMTDLERDEAYMAVVAHPPVLPLLEHLAQETGPLTAAVINSCRVDVDDQFEEFLSRADQEGLPPPPSGSSGGNLNSERWDRMDTTEQLRYTAYQLVERIKILDKKVVRMSEEKDAMIAHYEGKLSHLGEESDAKFIAARTQNDELHARILHLEETLEVEKESAENIRAEHAEYEAAIHRIGGMTIAEVSAKVDEIAATCRAYRSRYGETSWEYHDQQTQLKKFLRLYKIVGDRYRAKTAPRPRGIRIEEVTDVPSLRGSPSETGTSSGTRREVIARGKKKMTTSPPKRILSANPKKTTSTSPSLGGDPLIGGKPRVPENFCKEWLSFSVASKTKKK